MSLPLLATLFAIATILCLASGAWLLVHMTALTSLLRGHADIVASPKRPRASIGAVKIWLGVFVLSLGSVLALQVLAITR